MKRKTMASSLAIALTTSAVSMLATPAFAAGQNPYDTFDATTGAPAAAVVGVGSDTTQIVVHALTDAWNEQSTVDLASFAADGLPADVKLRTSSAGTVTRASINGSGNGKKLLYPPLNNTEVNFARSSSTLSTTEKENNLQQAAFAVDGLKMAVSTTTNAPASITPQQVVDIYKGVITNWSQIDPAKSGVIKPYHPQTGSGTYTFFKSQLDTINGGTVTFAGSVGVTQEHSPTEIQGDPNAIGPFSTARASGINTIQLLGGTEWKRAVYNVVRNADTTNTNITAIFGANGFLCSAGGREVIEEIGFTPLATVAQGGSCGQWTQNAVTDFTSFDDAGQTTTTLTGVAATDGTGKVTLTATIGGLTTDGTVKFFENDTQVGGTKTVVAGKAVLSLTGVAGGAHAYTAEFTPEDPQLAGPSEGELNLVVKKKSTTVLTLPASKPYGKETIAKATVSAGGSPATGSVEFFVDGVSKSTVDLAAGVASYTLPVTNVGNHVVKAVFLANDTQLTSKASKTVAITQALSTTTGSLQEPSVLKGTAGKVDAAVAITGAQAGVFATGAVKVKEVKSDGTKVTVGSATLADGEATITLTVLGVGKHNLFVKYPATTNVATSKSTTFQLTVTKP